MTRKYSIDEIRRMRRAIETILIRPMTPYNATEKNAQIEDQLRTYMLVGIEPQDLEKEASKLRDFR